MPDIATRDIEQPRRKRWRRPVWQAVGALGVILLVGFAALMISFQPATLDLPQVEVGALPAARPPAGMSISALPTGTYESPAALTYRGGAWGDKRHLAATAILIRHPKGNLLIDTGFGRGVDRDLLLIPAMQRSPMVKGRPVADWLAANGLKPSDLAAIVPTHAHWDHVSGIADLPGVPIMETTAARDWIATKAEGTQVLNSFKGLVYRNYSFEGGPYLGFARSHDVFGDGSVVIVPAPGHTPDSVIVFVALPSGARYAFIGDTTFQLEGINLPAEKPWMLRWLIGENNEEIHKDIALLRAARSRYRQIRIVPAHDGSAFASIPTLPGAAR